MWNPDKAPVLSFEKLARRVGLHRAREMWEAHRRRYQAAHAKARQQELAAAAQRYKRGPVVVRNDFDMAPTFHIAPITYKELHRSSLGQRGCKGGEIFESESDMKDFLKRHPECAPQKAITGDIRSGWTSALERAAKEGRMHDAMKFAAVSLRLRAAAAQAPAIIA